MNFDEVVKKYSETHSLRETALQCGISTGKVRKILVTCNAYDSELCRKVAELQKYGKTISEIADILRKSTQCIVSYVPYSRGERTGESQTLNAIRIRRCRERKQERG